MSSDLSDVTEPNSSKRDPLDLLIEQFLVVYRSGEPVTVQVYAEQHPEHQEQLLDLLPTLLTLEDVKRDRATSGTDRVSVSLPKLDRLGDFRIEGELGRGGMGVVFAAVQESLDRRVALKVVPQASLLTGNQLERFRREAQIAARLHHSNIVPVYGSGESDGYHWYAMQHIDGQSLDQWRQRQTELVPEGSGAWRSRARFVARMGTAAASALHYAHSLGTLHRDIKPANFMLDRDDHLWVTDFGLAKALEAEGLTHSGDLLGTLQYMAPEQFAGIYDVRSEVYALGVTLYEMLTLTPAFRGRHRSELMELVKSQQIEPLLRVCPDVPLDLATIVGKAMAREPRDRYATAEALEQDLEAFLEDRPIQARPLSMLATTWRWCRRNRVAASLVASTAAGVLLAAITGWIAYGVEVDALDRVTTSQSETKVALARVKLSELQAKKDKELAESSLRLNIATLGEVFDALVGRDPALSLDEDPDTGEQTVVVHSPLTERDVVLLRKMMAVYDQFASENEASQSLRYETARSYRRVGAIHQRLGEPDSLVEADIAFDKALSGFAGLTDRDVTRDLATLHGDIGKLRLRQYNPVQAKASFATALELLRQLPNAKKPAVQLECAGMLFELSRLGDRWPSRGGQGRGPGRGPGPGRSEELQQVLTLLQELETADPRDHRVRALHARVLLEGGSRTRGSTERLEALAILRELAAAHPDLYRYQFCDALLAGAAMSGRGRPVGSSAARLPLLREADQVAELLFEAQPLYLESRAMLMRARARYGMELHAAARRLEATAKAEQRQLAGIKLQSAVEIGQGLISEDGVADIRYLRDLTEAMCWLGIHYGDTDQPVLAKQQAMVAIDVAERTSIEAIQRFSRLLGRSGPGPGPGPEGEGPEGSRGDGPRGEGRRPGGARPRGDRPPRGEGRRGPPEGRRPERRPDGRRDWIRSALVDLTERLNDDEVYLYGAAADLRVKAAFDKSRQPR
ncbi:MAG: serine/threonine protein kinase/tetratricopeptide (TPR) repeat protein [Planctomycetota bacterium]